MRTSMMKKLRFSVKIDAPRERIWQVLWEPDCFRDWTSIFTEGAGARIQSEWRKGSRFEFFEGDVGSYGIIEQLVPDESVVFKHLGELQEGQEEPYGRPRLEMYTLRAQGKGSTLILQHEVLEEHRSMFEEATPKALARLKELAER
jgi:uncharacterized protein YndB with AHSA1/START domain